MKHVRYVSCAGGGTRGFMYIGMLEGLMTNMHRLGTSWSTFYKNLEGTVGTSVGCLPALAMILGLKFDVLTDILQCVIQSPQNVAPHPDIAQFVNKYGFDDGSTLRFLVKKLLFTAGLAENTTLDDIKRLLNKEFVCCTTNVSYATITYTSYKTYPDLQIAEAILMSMCVPFLFKPVSYGDDLFVDGSLCENLPRYFPEAETLFVCLSLDAPKCNITNWYQYIGAIASCGMKSQNKEQKYIETTYKNTCIVLQEPEYLRGDPVLNLRMQPVTAWQMINSGFGATLGFCYPQFTETLNATILYISRLILKHVESEALPHTTTRTAVRKFA